MINSKFMTSHTGLQRLQFLAVHTLSNISRSKSNQAMKSELIELSVANIFL